MKLEDRRVRRTKQLIKQSLIELMHEKPFKDITVKDITERADLNRGTFYLHYVDIYDLLSKIEDETLQAIEEMQTNGRYVDLFDFCRRVDLSKMNRRVIEILIKAGALDELSPKSLKIPEKCQFRANLLATLPEAIHAAEQHLRNLNSGQEDLFGLFGGDSAQDTMPTQTHLTEASAWSERILLENESDTLGFYLTTHPINRYRQELKSITTHPIGEILAMSEPPYRIARAKEPESTIAGLVIGIRSKFNQKGLKMTFVTLDDRSGRMELRLYDEHLENLSQPLTTKSVLIVKGTLTWDDFNNGMRIRPLELQHLEAVRDASAKSLALTNTAPFEIEKVQKLIHLMNEHKVNHGKPVYLKYNTDYANILLNLGPDWHLHLTDDLLEKLSSQFHELSMKVQY